MTPTSRFSGQELHEERLAVLREMRKREIKPTDISVTAVVNIVLGMKETS